MLGWPERDVWRMTPYKLLTLFDIHREFHPDRFKPPAPKGGSDLDSIFGGL